MARPPQLAHASVEELLRRCHRKELDHLIALLGVDARGKGQRDLSVALGRKLRWVGTHKLKAIFRGFKPAPYRQVLHELAARVKVKPGVTFEETEQAILEKHLAESWAQLSDEARLQLWSEQGLRPPVPKIGEKALDLVKDHLGEQASFGLSTLTLPGLLALAVLPLNPISIPALILAWLYAGPNDRILLPAILEVSRLRQLVLHRVTIGVVGSPSSGKDAAIKALFGIDHGNIDPVAGSTREVAITRLPNATATYVINTPGLGDVVESVTEEAKQILDHIDLYLYLVNAQGGVQAREKSDYTACVRSGRPVLAVVNKVDTLREKDRERYLADARKKLGAPKQDFLAAAFDPLPQLSETPIGLDGVKTWLLQRLLEAGKSSHEIAWLEPEAVEVSA